jgi:uncharacterized membrane protein
LVRAASIRGVSWSDAGLFVSVFLACTVEAVEALTIVIAVGVTRSWRSALWGVGSAVLVLAVLTAGLGPALTVIPLNALRIVVGGLLLIFGLGWLRKAILRAAGLKGLHDEDAAFAAQSAAARQHVAEPGAPVIPAGLDAYAFTVAFKGALLEGLEVVFIALTFGANQHDVPLAAVAAVAAVLVVAGAGVLVRAPLSRVPENTMKFIVGTLLTSFGMFWAGEGAGAHWPGGDASLVVIIPACALFALAVVGRLREPAVVPA